GVNDDPAPVSGRPPVASSQFVAGARDDCVPVNAWAGEVGRNCSNSPFMSVASARPSAPECGTGCSTARSVAGPLATEAAGAPDASGAPTAATPAVSSPRLVGADSLTS